MFNTIATLSSILNQVSKLVIRILRSTPDLRKVATDIVGEPIHELKDFLDEAEVVALHTADTLEEILENNPEFIAGVLCMVKFLLIVATTEVIYEPNL